MQNKRWLLVVTFAALYRSVLRLKLSSDIYVCAVQCAKIAPKKIFGWLRNIINSAGIRLAAKKIGGSARCRLTKFGAAALGAHRGLLKGPWRFGFRYGHDIYNTLSFLLTPFFRHSTRNRAVAVSIPSENAFSIPPVRHFDRLPYYCSAFNKFDILYTYLQNYQHS